MASFISALSLLILVLANGCFTLPVVDEQFWSSTFSPLKDDLTTEHAFNLRWMSNGETTVFPNLEMKRSSDEHWGVETSTSTDRLSEENASRASRMFDEHTTSESLTFTTEQSLNDKRDHDDLLFTTVEPITEVNEIKSRGMPMEFENETATVTQEMHVEFTTEQSLKDKRDHDDSLLTTVEPITEVNEFKSRGMPMEFENETATVTQEMQVEFTTNNWSSAPSTSTGKYIGLLKDDDEEGEPKKPMKTLRKPIVKSKVRTTETSQVQPEDSSDEDSKESTPPTAVFDQEALQKVSNVPNDFMILDENNDTIVTDLPHKVSTTTWKNVEQQKPRSRWSTTTWGNEEEQKPRSQWSTTTWENEEEQKPRSRWSTTTWGNEEEQKPRTRLSTTTWKNEEEQKPRSQWSTTTWGNEEEQKPRSRWSTTTWVNEEEQKPRSRLSTTTWGNEEEQKPRSRWSTTTWENEEEQKPLNQGKKSPHSEEKESDN